MKRTIDLVSHLGQNLYNLYPHIKISLWRLKCCISMRWLSFECKMRRKLAFHSWDSGAIMSPFLELLGLEMGFNRRENGLNHKNSVVCFLFCFFCHRRNKRTVLKCKDFFVSASSAMTFRAAEIRSCRLKKGTFPTGCQILQPIGYTAALHDVWGPQNSRSGSESTAISVSFLMQFSGNAGVTEACTLSTPSQAVFLALLWQNDCQGYQNSCVSPGSRLWWGWNYTAHPLSC